MSISASGSVICDLAQLGPDSTPPPCSLDDAHAYTRQLAIGHYENFPVVSWMLPRELRQHFYNVYAFCRWADDLGDEVSGSDKSLRLLSWWRNELERCYVGATTHPVYVALRPTIERFSIPIVPFNDLISAFEQDQRVAEYETFSQLQDYCRRSADPVGRIVLHLCECFNPQNVDWSDSICTGLQLANFWQDVARDHAIGRVYLPREDRERFGYTDESLSAHQANAAFHALMEFQVRRAREHLLAGLPLADAVPGRVKLDIELFIQGGLRILKRIEAIDYRVWETRPKVGKRDIVPMLGNVIWRRGTAWLRRRP
ncbi:MAG: squalene synthase HpnC [Planctomycetaceae bacterium]